VTSTKISLLYINVSVVLHELGTQKKLTDKGNFLTFFYCFPHVTSRELQNNVAR